MPAMSEPDIVYRTDTAEGRFVVRTRGDGLLFALGAPSDRGLQGKFLKRETVQWLLDKHREWAQRPGSEERVFRFAVNPPTVTGGPNVVSTTSPAATLMLSYEESMELAQALQAWLRR
jgi:hypothetical protein